MTSFVLLLALWSFAPSPSGDARYVPLVDGIITAWDTADVVCLGEFHGRRNDSELRLALVRDPRFVSTCQLIVVEMANGAYQDVLDRFVLDGVEMSRERLSVVWRNATAPEEWESPVYEEFLRAVRQINLALPREDRVRVIAGDSPLDWRGITRPEHLESLFERGLLNRRGNIRGIMRQVLDRRVKALAIYGTGHCTKRGRGFPGELAAEYPGRIWTVSGFAGTPGARWGQSLFGLDDRPAYLIVRDSRFATMAAGSMFQPDESYTVGETIDAVLWYGGVDDVVVKSDLRHLYATYGPELARRKRLLQEALTRSGP